MHTVPSPQSRAAWGAGMRALIFRHRHMVEDEGHGSGHEKQAVRQFSTHVHRTARGKTAVERASGGEAVCREFEANGGLTVIGWIKPMDGKSQPLAVVVTAQDAHWFASPDAPVRLTHIPYNQPCALHKVGETGARPNNHAAAVERIIRRVYAERFSGQSPALNS